MGPVLDGSHAVEEILIAELVGGTRRNRGRGLGLRTLLPQLGTAVEI